MKYGDKEIKVDRVKNGNGFEVKFTTGGEIPAELKGIYTSPSVAESAVLTYVETVKGEKKRGSSQRD